MSLETNTSPLVTEASEASHSNGALIAGATALAGAALLSSVRSAQAAVNPPLKFAQIPGSGDIKVLNYALALEALEADLYDQALKRLTTGGTNALGQTITGLNLPNSNPVVDYTSEFRQVEIDHRDFLINVLKTQAITNTTLKGAKFDFGINSKSETGILDFLITVEALGVGAYLGAIPKFSTKKYLQIAAAIQGTEARHTAALIVIKNLYYGGSQPPAPLYNQNHGIDVPVEPDTVLATASTFIVLP